MNNFMNMIKSRNKEKLSTSQKKEVAKLLQIQPEALEAFEKAYHKEMLNEPISNNLFQVSAKEAKNIIPNDILSPKMNSLVNRIVNELVSQTKFYSYENGTITEGNYGISFPENSVTKKELLEIPPELRPQLTGTLMQKEIPDEAYPIVLGLYARYLKETNPKIKQQLYGSFRQGLEIQDLDEILYRVLDRNRNSIGNWFPQLAEAIKKQEFFQIPNTTIIKVPLTLLQMARLEYMSLTKSTREIANRFCTKVFHLEEDKEYFIKNGVFSSKYDFRNAHIYGAEEVRTLGEYLLYIQYQAGCYAHYDLSGKNQPIIYGPGTTTEWVCREFIPDKENNPCIYKGLPLHTEYRVFIDVDQNIVLGISPYWRSDVMKQRFGHEEDRNSPHQIHDYIIYCAHEKILMERYEQNKEQIVKAVASMLPDLNLSGQWSLDIMQNGTDFYIIDMALAQNSALNDCVPNGLLQDVNEDWIPMFDSNI